ncbi:MULTISPECIES: 2-succinyl-5-enolpyruvyl-6-hydroxy-3-cyclohexene-1-carboxylic-acid synthase [unclassified Synechocystis]|uniref:2-succinyl-5-enolpyruvyl-6-hydroxy-3- cyclohexene-1-carboxylic-acid synthase n=1 Tax=unclassified Synechocystis TaxID=2640012 RepID=UPI000413AB20|nr:MULTISPECIES: 2-succinyl-5-enolpyruvyl-6-hydroxy-3-cyclohexene-1-carboxylic-acid synthase [unclassified Synechocystis]AIE73149.1 2-succinyl-5-enolpyruvyl-6-hydroxy-3- cyclohexene-1-carboxylic-acid synthase [Synechocystis sp. PCC 6714]MCT0254331.1 2-succinyl-5-enolpyruvyl-6-hydroxy-3-cyclohexene-1-carboxylic-acid synthase [Synechocystis sp. CS-94]
MVDFTNLNGLAASLLVETLFRLGLRQAVICPGSRSSPLTVALARHGEIDCVVSLDERSASFFALGYGKRTGKPALLVCTSGTAAANFLPAIIEAHYSQVPLLVLTGDRPPKLRHCRAGQTIDQTKLYGHYPQWQTELALPEASLDFCHYLRQTVLHGWQKCFWPRLGVVHLNCPFDEPLAPLADDSVQVLAQKFDANSFYWGITEFNQLWPALPINFSSPVVPLLPWDFPKIGLILVGVIPGGEAHALLTDILAIAKALHYPVLCDALCSLRNYDDGETVLITNYDFLVRCQSWAEQLVPEQIIQIGELPTSKALRNWLSIINCPRYVFNCNGENLDPLQGQTVYSFATIGQLADYLHTNILPIDSIQKEYTHNWQEKQAKSQAIIASAFINPGGNTPSMVSQLVHCLPPQTNLLVANSLPVRWLEFFWPANGDRHRIFVNRGANGIDGTLSTAMGISHRSIHQTVLLTGDLSLLHDSNGFLNQSQMRGNLTIILLNNNGGGIFQTLPIAQCEDVFETYFATPQSVDFAQLCGTYGVDHHVITDLGSLKEQLETISPTPIRVLEIIGDRHQEAQWLKSLQTQFCHADEPFQELGFL